MKRKRRYAATTMAEVKKNAIKESTPEELRKAFPKKLVDAFVKCSKSNYNDKEYEKYINLAKGFLDKKFEDKIEQCKLVVRLTNATFDLTEKKNGKKEKNKSKKSEELARGQCVEQESRPDERQEEGSKQEEVPQGEQQC